MTHNTVRLTINRQALKSAYQTNIDATFTHENMEQTCEIPSDSVMLGILHRLLLTKEDHSNGNH
jgi:hypothetical protein